VKPSSGLAPTGMPWRMKDLRRMLCKPGEYK
jgi:hypothetical protein